MKIETKLQKDLFIIQYDAEQVDPAAIIEEIDALGFTGKEIDEKVATAEPEQPEGSREKSALVEELLQQARRENKALVLEFSGKFCPACKRLEKETLEHPKVQEALKKVIFRKIMVEQDRTAATQFGIHAIPQLRFLTPDGKVVAQDKGVISVEAMLAHLQKLGGKGSPRVALNASC